MLSVLSDSERSNLALCNLSKKVPVFSTKLSPFLKRTKELSEQPKPIENNFFDAILNVRSGKCPQGWIHQHSMR